MADTIPNVKLPKGGEWIDIFTELGIAVGTPITLQSLSAGSVQLSIGADIPVDGTDGYQLLIKGEKITTSEGGNKVWASSLSGGVVNVSSFEFAQSLRALLYDGYGNPINSLGGAIDTHAADVHRQPVNDFVHRHGDATTLNAAVTSGDVQISVVDNTDFIVGAYVHMGEITSTKEPTHPRVTIQDGGGNLITLDRPIDFSYPNGETVTPAIVNMLIGSAAATINAPVSFKYRPHNGNIEHITRLLLSMTHTSASADNLFGGGAALPNGVVVRASINGNLGTFTNWKSNQDIKLDMYDVTYSDKVGGSLFGTNGRGSFSRIGVVIRLDPAQNDYLEFLVQDPITVLTLEVKMQGHVEGG